MCYIYNRYYVYTNKPSYIPTFVVYELFKEVYNRYV